MVSEHGLWMTLEYLRRLLATISDELMIRMIDEGDFSSLRIITYIGQVFNLL